jgi:hypothetical protein
MARMTGADAVPQATAELVALHAELRASAKQAERNHGVALGLTSIPDDDDQDDDDADDLE